MLEIKFFHSCPEQYKLFLLPIHIYVLSETFFASDFLFVPCNPFTSVLMAHIDHPVVLGSTQSFRWTPAQIYVGGLDTMGLADELETDAAERDQRQCHV